MSLIGKLHAACVKRISALFHRLTASWAIVGVQDPVHLTDFSEPQPDIALLKLQGDFYAQAHPTPNDILLIVEVADASIEYDRRVEVPLCARAGIPVVWLVDLNADIIEVYSHPENGSYQESQVKGRGDYLSLTSLPDLRILVADMLG